MIEKNNIQRFTIAEIFYYGYFTLILSVKGMGFYEGQWPFDVAIVIAGFLLVIKLFLTENSLIEWIIITLLISISIIIFIHSNQMGIFMIIGTIVGMKNIPIRRVMTLGGFVWTITFSVKIVISLLGIQSDIFRVQKKLGLGYIIRWSLGQSHPNVLQISCIILCIFIMYLFHFKGRRLLVATTIMIVANLYVFLYSVSYTGIILAFVYLFINYYMVCSENRTFGVIEKIVMIAVVPVCAAFSILGPLFFPDKLWNICNKILNTRFQIAKEYMSLNRISWFGVGYCDELPVELNNLDCSYVFSLMHYGIIFFVLMIMGLTGLIVYLMKESKKLELGIVLSLAIAGISEPFFVNSSFKNVVWIFLGAYIYILTVKLGRGLSNRVSRLGNKEIVVDCSAPRKIAERLIKILNLKLKCILVISLVIGITAAGIYATHVNMPSAYYMNRNMVQTDKEHGFTIDINNLPEGFDGKFLQYTNAETLMFSVDGNAVTLEYVRGIISMFVWIYIGVGLLSVIYLYYRDNVKKL